MFPMFLRKTLYSADVALVNRIYFDLFQEFSQNCGAEMLNGRRIRALRSSTSGHASFRTRLLQRSSIVPPEAHYKAHGPRVSHTGSLCFNKIRRPPVRLGRNHVERRTRKTAVCGQRTETCVFP